MRRRGRSAIAAAVLLLAAGTAGARADVTAGDPADPAATTTTTTTEAPTTTAPAVPPPVVTAPTTVPGADPAPTTPVTTPGSTSTTKPPVIVVPPAGDTSGEADAAPEDAPPVGIVVPPVAPGTVLPPPPTGLVTVVRASLVKAQAAAAKAAADRLAADEHVADLERLLTVTQERLTSLRSDEVDAVDRVLRARDRVRKRAVAAYTGGDLRDIDMFFAAQDINQLLRGLALVQSSVNQGNAEVREYRLARDAISEEASRRVADLDRIQSDLVAARQVAAFAAAVVTNTEVDLSAIAAGSAIVIHGFVFPVAGAHNFSNDFGAPRLMGTLLAHWHQGNDIFGLPNTPLVACERGVIARMGTDRLGGTKLWLVGESGTSYYYAHLTAYAPGLTEGMVVPAGTLVGFMGNTGDARGGPTHLHFEVHPNGGAAVNPYPLLRAVDTAAATPVAQPLPPPPPPVPPTVPTTVAPASTVLTLPAPD